MLDGYAALVGARHARAALGEDAPAGTSPAVVVAPGGEDEAAAVLAHASASGHAVLLKGGGTKLDWGRPPARCDVVLSTERLAGVVSHDAGDLVCTVRAGTRLADLRAIVEAEPAHRQAVMLDPRRRRGDGRRRARGERVRPPAARATARRATCVLGIRSCSRTGRSRRPAGGSSRTSRGSTSASS